MSFPIFPLGDSQTLQIGSLSVTFEWWEFDGDSDGEWGYQRSEDFSQQVTVSESLFGASILEGQSFSSKYIFKWALNLTNDKLFLLKALFKRQQALFKSQNDGSIRLLDQRLILTESEPRIRAKIGDLIVDPIPPQDFNFFWPQFNILLNLESDFSQFFMLPSDGMRHKVIFSARELDIVDPSEDLVLP